ncbi:MAG: pentapeptide repeat-containing protein [bacterium]|nr:pentapeptide repeat-containing protein [bacterium]MDZ4296461.1 pentapeptide repeat-containing protein [Patescibacteria group bacterium]
MGLGRSNSLVFDIHKNMNSFEHAGNDAHDRELEQLRPLLRQDVEARIARGEHFEQMTLRDLDLSGLSFDGMSFRGADIRGSTFYRSVRDAEGNITEEHQSSIQDCEFTDAIVADLGPEVFLGRINGRGTRFGYTEQLSARRDRHARETAQGRLPSAEDSGGFYNFNGSEGNFQETTWKNIDFGGGSGYEAIFHGADLRNARFEGCDLSFIDLSTAILDGILIQGPISVQGMVISSEYVDDVARGVAFDVSEEQKALSRDLQTKGSRQTLVESLGVEVVEPEGS